MASKYFIIVIIKINFVKFQTLSTGGYYMYIEAKPQKKGDKARLITPKYPFFQNGYCLSLYYHMFGWFYLRLKQKKKFLF